MHPVTEVLRERAAGHGDDHCVALVLEGGAMRGVVSAGMTAALERLGLSAAFDLVVKRLNPDLVALYHGRVESCERVVQDIARRSEILRTAAEQAERLVADVLS